MGQDNSDQLIKSIAEPYMIADNPFIAYHRNDSARCFVQFNTSRMYQLKKMVYRPLSDLKHLGYTPYTSTSFGRTEDCPDGRESIQSILGKCNWSERLDE